MRTLNREELSQVAGGWKWWEVVLALGNPPALITMLAIDTAKEVKRQN